MNKTIDLKKNRVRFTDITKLGKRIISFAEMKLDQNQLECYKALIDNYNKGNYHKANDIANMLDSSLNNLDMQPYFERNFTIIK